MTTKGSILLFGGSRGAGLEFARLAAEAGHKVIAVTRKHSEKLEELGISQVTGDAIFRDQVFPILEEHKDVQAVVSTMGGDSSDGRGNINVMEAAKMAGVSRFILVSSLGAGESRAYASERLLAAIGSILEEKTQAEEVLVEDEDWDFTIIRPGQLFDAPPTGKAILKEDPSLHGGIPRADLAALILQCVNDPDTIGRTYTAIVPNP